MSKKEKKQNAAIDAYTKNTHRTGRIFVLMFCVYIMVVPLVICAVYGVWPTFKQMLPGAIAILSINVPVCIAEVGSYTPILGSSCYLTFATGNLMNLKIPCALNAQKVAKVEQNTAEGDAIALISTCVSSIVTLIVLFIGVLLIAPLKGILQNEYFSTASNYLLPALFGCMTLGMIGRGNGPTYVKNKLLIMVVPAVLISILTVMGIASTGLAGILILVMIPVTILCARILWKLGIVKVLPNPNASGSKEASE
ncbi:MAG: hypothetical protein PUI73_04535 [bacterium]|nr:hypothetical protein [bacterium]MDY5457024.1 hypothetical protein [Bariatricus sp.]